MGLLLSQRKVQRAARPLHSTRQRVVVVRIGIREEKGSEKTQNTCLRLLATGLRDQEKHLSPQNPQALMREQEKTQEPSLRQQRAVPPLSAQQKGPLQKDRGSNLLNHIENWNQQNSKLKSCGTQFSVFRKHLVTSSSWHALAEVLH